MSSGSAFQQSGVVTVAASTASALVQLAGTGDTCIVSNPGTATAWILFGAAGQPLTAAVGTGYPVLAGQQRAIGISPLVGQAAVILFGGSVTIILETGNGSGH